MSEFDRQNEDVFQIVHNNPRRRGVSRTIGYIVPQEQAEQFAAFEATQQRNRTGGYAIFLALLLPVLAAFAVGAGMLIG